MNQTSTLSSQSSASVRGRLKSKPDWLRISVHLIGLFALLQLTYFWLFDKLTVNPIQFIEQHLGRAAVTMLVLSLAVTPLVTLTGWRSLTRHRRTLGLYAFFYFSLHFLTFAVLDYGLDWKEIIRLTTEKPFIIVGLSAGLILIALAATSFKFWMKRLGKNWKRLHMSIYLASGLVILHYAWAVKGSLTSLSGDILRPLMMGLLVVLLLILRIPPVRRWAASLRQRIGFGRFIPSHK
jgi:methionine sulfoxide reductase heme-binding subunit